MFTGIVEQKCKIMRIEKRGNFCRLTLTIPEFSGNSGPVKSGESICVNGVCLTLSDCSGNSLTFDVTGETLARTNLSSLKTGDRVNVEQALRVGDRLGGHFVTGHIDGTARVKSVKKYGKNVVMEFSCEKMLRAYMIEKGSVAVEGVSLTIVRVTRNGFSVALIPHTLKTTTLGERRAGTLVNIECDVLGKWVKKLVGGLTGTLRESSGEEEKSQKITRSFLEKHGFT